MEHISTYKKLTSKIEALKEKIEFKSEIFDLDERLLKEKAYRKLKKFIKKEEQKRYLSEFGLLNIEDEVNKRLPSAMRKFNIKDYWKRREVIQNWRNAKQVETLRIQKKNEYDEFIRNSVAINNEGNEIDINFSCNKEKYYKLREEIEYFDRLPSYEEECLLFNTCLSQLDVEKKIYEEQVKEKLYKKLLPYFVNKQEREAKLAQHNQFVENSVARVTEFKAKLNEETDEKIRRLRAKKEKLISKLENEIKNLETKRLNEKDESYSLEEDVVLRVKNLTMQFGGLKAVDNLSFDVKKGEIFGLIGPNGAGKTTVFNCITQFYKPTKGELYFKEKSGNTISLTDYAVHDVIKKGIVRTFQNVELVKEVSVLDNLLIAAHTQYKSNLVEQFLHLPILKKEEIAIREKAEEVLEFMGLSLYKNYLAWGLPYGILKKIEIARTLMNNPQLIILDEPAAGLNDTETAELTQLIRKIQEKYNCTILLVEHDMGLVMDICDTVCAISFGKLLALGTTEEIQANKDVQAAYLGYSEED